MSEEVHLQAGCSSLKYSTLVFQDLWLSPQRAGILEEDRDNKVKLVVGAKWDCPRVHVHQCCQQVEEVMTAGIRIESE